MRLVTVALRLKEVELVTVPCCACGWTVDMVTAFRSPLSRNFASCGLHFSEVLSISWMG